MFDTADNSLMVYIFGTEKSRPFTQSLHSFVGIGFVIGSALSSPFLPYQETEKSENVCPSTNNVTSVVRQNPNLLTKLSFEFLNASNKMKI